MIEIGMGTPRHDPHAVDPRRRAAALAAIEEVLRDDRREKYLACRVLMRLLVADGVLKARERTMLEATMDRCCLDLATRGAIWAESLLLLSPGSVADPTVHAAAAQSLDALLDGIAPAGLEELLVHLHHGAWADGEAVAAEQGVIARVEQRLAQLRVAAPGA